MMMEEEFQDRNNNLSVNDIDLSLLRLTSPPYSHSSSFFSAVSPEISPLKRSSPVSDESDHPKRRKISPQNPIFITSPLLFTYPETQSSSIDDDPTRNNPKLVAGETHENAVQETTPCGSSSKTPPDTEVVIMSKAFLFNLSLCFLLVLNYLIKNLELILVNRRLRW